MLRLAFVGTNYTGWQSQKTGLSIQEVIETAIGKITGETVALIGCSRTDAGVHAEDYIANFLTDSRIPTEKFQPAIQTKLPRDIQVLRSREVAPSFNARRNSYEKTYRYQLYLGSSPFLLDRWWQYGDSLDYTALEGLARLTEGRHDFAAFCVHKSLKQDNHCSIKYAAWSRSGRKLYYKIIGDRFLHHMVRFLVGAQIRVAAGELTRGDFELMLGHPEKKRALFPAPAAGLYLMKVKFNQQRRTT